MHMIRHDDEGIHFGVWEMRRNFVPAFLHNSPQFINQHFTIIDLSINTIPPIGNESKEISSRLGIIISFQTDGMPA